MPNITEWFRSAWAFTKAVGLYWIAGLFLAGDILDVWPWLRSAVGELPKLPDPLPGWAVTCGLVLILFVGAVQAYHKLRMEYEELREALEPGFHRCIALDTKIADAERMINRWTADELEAEGMTGWVERWEHDVEILLDDEFGRGYAQRFTADLEGPADADHILEYAHLAPRLRERVERLKQIRSEVCRGEL